MAKTSKDARRHIKEWSEFFQSGKAAVETDVRNLIAGYKKRKYLAQSLQRLIDRGFIKKEGKFFRPTKIGLKFFRKLTIKKEQVAVPWDGKWRLVSFDVPGSYNRARDHIRAILREFDFYPLHKSVWIFPKAASDRFWKLLVSQDLDKYCKTMVVEILEGEEELRRFFNL